MNARKWSIFGHRAKSTTALEETPQCQLSDKNYSRSMFTMNFSDIRHKMIWSRVSGGLVLGLPGWQEGAVFPWWQSNLICEPDMCFTLKDLAVSTEAAPVRMRSNCATVLVDCRCHWSLATSGIRGLVNQTTRWDHSELNTQETQCIQLLLWALCISTLCSPWFLICDLPWKLKL